MKNNRFVSAFLVMVFLFSLTAKETQAKWNDKSSNLPGMVSDGQMIALAVGGAVLITGIIIFSKKKKEKEVDSSSVELKTNPLVFTESYKTKSFYNELCKAAEQSPVQIFADCSSLENKNFCNKQVMSVGVRIKF